MRKIFSGIVKEAREYSPVHYLYLLFSIVVASLLILLISLELAARSGDACYPPDVSYSGKLAANLAKTFSFNYRGDGNCKLAIIPEWKPLSPISIWVYRPNSSVDFYNYAEVKNSVPIVVENATKGGYKISIKNEAGIDVSYKLKLSSQPKSQNSLAEK